MVDTRSNKYIAAEFGLDVLSSDLDLFRWFLLCYLFGKPIRLAYAVTAWRIFVERKLDAPSTLARMPEFHIAQVLQTGNYKRYKHITAHGLKMCAQQLVEEYEGSLQRMIVSCQSKEEFLKRFKQFHGVGPRVAEIFMCETEELFAQEGEWR